LFFQIPAKRGGIIEAGDQLIKELFGRNWNIWPTAVS
jgi:hypothetical protein